MQTPVVHDTKRAGNPRRRRPGWGGALHQLVVGSALMAVLVGCGSEQAGPAPEEMPRVETWAGSGNAVVGDGALLDGPALEARFNEPTGLAADAEGNIFVADFGNHVIRKVSPGGNVVTLAGSGQPGLKDGRGTEAEFNGPTAIAVDRAGRVIVADTGNHRIRVIESDGTVTTLAGTGPSGLGRGAFADGPAAAARFNLPKGIAVDAEGNVFVADTDNLRIRVIRDTGIVETYAGTGEIGSADGPRLKATLGHVQQIALDEQGGLWIVDQSNRLLRRITPDGSLVTVVRDGLGYLAGVTAIPGGLVAVGDTSSHVIRIFSGDGTLVTAFGSGRQGYRDGPSSLAEFSNPAGLVSWRGLLLVADSGNHRLRVLFP